MDNDLLESKGRLCEAPSKSENYKDRIPLKCFDRFDVIKDYILEQYDRCIKSMEDYRNNTKSGAKAIDDYLLR